MRYEQRFRRTEYMNIKVKSVHFKMPRQSSEKLEMHPLNVPFSYNALIKGTSDPCFEAVRLRTMPFPGNSHGKKGED